MKVSRNYIMHHHSKPWVRESGVIDPLKCQAISFIPQLSPINAQHTPNSIQTNKSPSECVKKKPGWSQLLLTTGS
jgi:hypothetical protein